MSSVTVNNITIQCNMYRTAFTRRTRNLYALKIYCESQSGLNLWVSTLQCYQNIQGEYFR